MHLVLRYPYSKVYGCCKNIFYWAVVLQITVFVNSATVIKVLNAEIGGRNKIYLIGEETKSCFVRNSCNAHGFPNRVVLTESVQEHVAASKPCKNKLVMNVTSFSVSVSPRLLW